MGLYLYIDEKSRILRVIKTVFFLITMLASLLIFSAPILLIITDTLLPSALLSIASSFSPISPSSSLSFIQTLSSHLNNYDFRYSLVDIPLISIFRSAAIFCVYSICDGLMLSRGRYLIVTMLCSISSLVFVSLKASFVFGGNGWKKSREGHVKVMEIALFMCSLVLAIAHIVVAYRTSWRERRKVLIYNIDIEALKEAHIALHHHKWDLIVTEVVFDGNNVLSDVFNGYDLTATGLRCGDTISPTSLRRALRKIIVPTIVSTCKQRFQAQKSF